MKPGWKTTEFWVTILGVIGAATAGLENIVSPTVAGIMMAISSAAYALSRGLAKK
jgi:hypothetical protein